MIIDDTALPKKGAHSVGVAPRFASVSPTGPPQRIGDKGMQHLPGEEAWLIGERRVSGEHKHYLCRPAQISKNPCRNNQGAFGSANGRISNSRKNSASTISEGDPGMVCVVMR